MMNLEKIIKKEKKNFLEKIKLEFKIIKSCQIIGGALSNLPCFFEKIRSIKSLNFILWQLENQLKEESQIAFENLKNAVDWVHKKLKQLRYLKKICENKNNSDLINEIDNSLKFNVISFNRSGYFGHIFSNLQEIVSEAVNYPEYHSILKNWVKIESLNSGEFAFSQFILPDFVQKELEKPSLEEEIYKWQEKMDTSLLELFRFLKILEQYKSFVPLTINPSSYVPPKNLQELEFRQYQAYVGFYLSCFKSSNLKEHPITLEELINLINRFILMLKKEISNPSVKGPKLKKALSLAAEEYCIKELVNHVSKLSQKHLEVFKKNRYDIEVYEFLVDKAKKSGQIFVDSITPTLIKERVGPKANRILFEKFGIVWHKIFKK